MKVGNICLEEAFTAPEQLVSKFAKALEAKHVGLDQFDTLVGTGLSGSLVVPILARAAGKDFMITRKPGDSHHHGSAVAEGDFNDSGKWLFVDDGIGTGTTYRRTRKLVNKLATENSLPDKFHGAYLYGHLALHPAEFWTPGDLERAGIKPDATNAWMFDRTDEEDASMRSFDDILKSLRS